jgi:squalene cyclase
MDGPQGGTAPPTYRQGRRSPNVSVARALERGARFLLAHQDGDGLWRDFLTPAGQASEWPTGFIGTALQLACAPTKALERAGHALLARQKASGGWGYNEDVPSDADSTAWVLLFLRHLGCSGAALDRATSCLVRHQRGADGGVATYSEPGPIRRFMGLGRWVPCTGWCMPHTEVTAVAGRAHAALSPDRCPVETAAAWRFVRSRQRADGSWSSYWWMSPHYTTLQAVELALLLGDHDAVTRAALWASRTQDEDGGWNAPGCASSPFATAMSLSILLNAKASGAHVEQAVVRLVAMQESDGGWPSHPIMRIPLPGDRDPNGERRWRLVRFSGGVLVADQHRTFTSAACITALARARTEGCVGR